MANVSHELKTPLAVIKSNVEALQDGAVEDPEARVMFLGQTSKEADRLEALIQDLLSLARIESGEQGLELQSVPLDKAILDCLERHQAQGIEEPYACGSAAAEWAAGRARVADPDACARSGQPRR